MKKLSVSKIINYFVGLAQKTGGEIGGDKCVAQDTQSLARQLAADGVVLIKNDGMLPLEDCVVSVFGRVQYDYFCVGYGSGGDVKAPYKISLNEGLKNSTKIKLNDELDEIYKNWCVLNPPDEGFWGHWPLYFDEMPITADDVKKAASKSDAAIVVIGRAAGEDREQKLVKGGFYLTDDETALLDNVTTAFEKTAVVIDAGNVIDLSWIKKYGDKLSAVLLAWQGGMESGNAVADVLTGTVNPSGRLSDTIAREYSDYPSAQHFGNKKYNEYVEDVYVGYRYFETFAKDKVLYPFGYGLSYTSFDYDYSFGFDGQTATLEALIKNVGKRSGKSVLQVYVEPPLGKLGKPLRNLVGYEKTAELQVNQSAHAEIIFDLNSLTSYDDAGITGHKSCYIAEVGEYKVYAGENVRDAKQVGYISLKQPYVKQAEEICPVQTCDTFKVMYPGKSADGYAVKYRDVATETRDLKQRIENRLPAAIPQKTDFNVSFDDVKSGKLSLDEFIASLSLDELEMLTHGDYRMNSALGAAGNAGAFGGVCDSLKKRGVPAIITTDGPSGIRLGCYAALLPCGTAVASAWNDELTEKVFACVGREMKLKGSDVLLAPGMNIHRNPLCGRNFEYFSEDPLLSGKTAAAYVRGIQSEGVSACPKHFACNNQETNRNHNDSRVSERALREIYLKGFGICVRESSPHLMMTSYNRINGIHSYNNYDLCTTLLRGEYGYKGLITTDWWTVSDKDPNFSGIYHHGYRVRAQADVVMPGGNRVNGKNDGSALKSMAGGLTLGELQRVAKNVLNFILESGK